LSAGLTGFTIGSVIAATLVRLYFMNNNNNNNNNKNNSSNNEELNDDTNKEVVVGVDRQQQQQLQELPEEIRAEQLSRNTLYFGEEGMKDICGASVLIVGLGGVGSHTAHMLARAGVGYLRLIDFDQVTVSSLNRHACATLEDVGIPKVVAMSNFLKKVCPDPTYMQIDARVQMYTGDLTKDGTIMDLPPNNNNNGSKKWDFVVDAIDDVPTKARLLAHCANHNLRVISCMGAGGKSDITRLHISNLRSASRDPLASKLRQTLKRLLLKNSESSSSRNGDDILEDVDRLATLYSSEKTVVKLADITPEQKEQGIQNFGAVDNMRVRVMPVLGTMPAVMGQSLAAYVLCELGNKPFFPMAGERVGRNVRHKMFQHLKNREKAIRQTIEAENNTTTNDNNNNNDVAHDDTITKDGDKDKNVVVAVVTDPQIIGNKWVGPVQVDMDDMEYIFAEVWRNRCCVTGDTLGTVLEIVRWDISKPSNCQNLVVMGAKSILRFDEAAASNEDGDGRQSIPLPLRQRIQARLATCKIDSKA